MRLLASPLAISRHAFFNAMLVALTLLLLSACGSGGGGGGGGSADGSVVTGLNDTGITRCADDADNNQDCPVAGYSGQDAEHGRDAAALGGTLSKTGAGDAGFDFTKIANDGSELDESAALGPDPTDWACTRDNRTGLIWEVKVNDSSHLRHQFYKYTWFSTDGSTNGGDEGSATGSTNCDGGTDCHTEKFVADVNAAGLCGATDWRMPAVEELQSIAHLGRASGAAIDTDYFPNTSAVGFWSSETVAASPSSAWFVTFGDGHSAIIGKGSGLRVRLVREP